MLQWQGLGKRLIGSGTRNESGMLSGGNLGVTSGLDGARKLTIICRASTGNCNGNPQSVHTGAPVDGDMV